MLLLASPTVLSSTWRGMHGRRCLHRAAFYGSRLPAQHQPHRLSTAVASSSRCTAVAATHSNPPDSTGDAKANAASSFSASGANVASSSSASEYTPGSSAGKPLRVERLLANLGYGNRKEATLMIKRKQLVYADTGQPAKVWGQHKRGTYCQSFGEGSNG